MDMQPAWKVQGLNGLEKPGAKRAKRLLRLSLWVLLFACFLWLIMYLFNPIHFPIRSVKIMDPQGHVNQAALQRESLPFVNNGFFRLNVTALQQRLQHIPWVDRCEVTRFWPDQIEIRLIEQQAIAQWNGHDLINTRGELFNPGNIDVSVMKLPQLIGPSEQQTLALQTYRQLSDILTPLQLSIAKLELTPRQSWQLTLQNGMNIILGREDLARRLQRFVKLYPNLVIDKNDNIDYADLRYHNGIAVHWKETNLQ